MSDFKTSDIISFAIQQKPIEFENAFKALIHDKLVDAVDMKKQEIAKSLFNPQYEEEDDFDLEQDTEETQDA
jgi:hypothetical protein